MKQFIFIWPMPKATDKPLARKVLIDIANEERIRAGGFARMLSILTGDEDALLEK